MDFKFFGWATPNFNSENAILFNNDCRNLLNTFPCESIDLFCSDIPYKLTTSSAGVKKEGKKYMRWYVQYL